MTPKYKKKPHSRPSLTSEKKFEPIPWGRNNRAYREIGVQTPLDPMKKKIYYRKNIEASVLPEPVP